MTTVTVDYDCPNRCRFEVPTTIPETGSALHHASAVDTVTTMVDAQHEAGCPDRKAAR